MKFIDSVTIITLDAKLFRHEYPLYKNYKALRKNRAKMRIEEISFHFSIRRCFLCFFQTTRKSGRVALKSIFFVSHRMKEHQENDQSSSTYQP